MNPKHIINYIVLVLIIALLGQVFYYAVWLLTDDEFRSELAKGWPFNSLETLVDYGVSCIFTTFATIYYWRSRERIEKERTQLRLQVLDNQLSPHFVFNNFSILAELIEVNPPKAFEYLMHLSTVYRYSLIHQDHQIVSLQEELIFLQQYIELLKARFGDVIHIDMEPELQTLEGCVPPCVLQLLIENAIKHNEHTVAHPLNISISSAQNAICIINQRRTVASVDSANVGQHNIEERYRLLTRKKVVIQKSENEYCVILPLLEK